MPLLAPDRYDRRASLGPAERGALRALVERQMRRLPRDRAPALARLLAPVDDVLAAVAPRSVERLNWRLALALGADAGVVTKPHTILRPAGSMNWKHSPPTPVRLVAVRPTRRVACDELDRQLPREQPQIENAAAVRARRPWRAAAGDPLEVVPPPVYFEQLTEIRVGRSGKVPCPFHPLSGRRAVSNGVSPAPSVADASVSDRRRGR